MTSSMLKKIVAFLGAWALSAALVSGCHCVVHVTHDTTPQPVYVKTAPPASKAETQPPPPSASHVWTAGSWEWNEVDDDWEWEGGTWEIPPDEGYEWVEPEVEERDEETWVFTPGHWKNSAKQREQDQDQGVQTAPLVPVGTAPPTAEQDSGSGVVTPPGVPGVAPHGEDRGPIDGPRAPAGTPQQYEGDGADQGGMNKPGGPITPARPVGQSSDEKHQKPGRVRPVKPVGEDRGEKHQKPGRVKPVKPVGKESGKKHQKPGKVKPVKPVGKESGKKHRKPGKVKPVKPVGQKDGKKKDKAKEKPEKNKDKKKPKTKKKMPKLEPNKQTKPPLKNAPEAPR